jgi:seryl-tRNA synthetase
MFSFTAPEHSWDEHEKLLEHAEKLVQGLKLPYRITNICTADIGNTAAKKYDIEVWFPGQDTYRELISCSNCTDYQARRLNIRFHDPNSEKPRVLHTLNSTALPISRTIVAIMENNQEADGTIKIPKVLQKYMGGIKKIKPKKHD